MLGGSLPLNILRFAWPLMLANILQRVFNAADVIVVGKFAGDTALAAVSSTGSMINLLITLFICLAVGINVEVAAAVGRRDEESARNALHTGMLLGLLGGIVAMVLGWFAAPMLMRWTETPDSVMDQAVTYLRIYLMGSPANLVYNFGAAALRGNGDSNRALGFLTVAGVVNVILNLIFVIGFGWGVAGVAAATVASQLLSAVLVVRCLMQENGAVHLDLGELRIIPESVRAICVIAIPAGLQGVVIALSNTVVQASVNSLGEIFMAGYGAAASVDSLVYIAMNAFYQASMTFTSCARGAGQIRRADKILGWCSLWVTGFGLCLGGLVNLFGPQLLSLYTDTPQAIVYGQMRLAVVGLLYFLGGLFEVVMGSLRGLGSMLPSMIISVFGMSILRLIWCETVFVWYPTGKMLLFCYPVTWTIALIAELVCYAVLRRRAFRKEDELKAAVKE